MAISVAGLRSNEREVIALSDRAFRARVRCFEYAARELTDGILTAEELSALGIAPAVRKELLERGLWQQYEGGIFMRDYLNDNPTRDEVEARRKSVSERVKRHRDRIVTPSVTPASNALQDALQQGVTEGVTGGVTPEDSPTPPPIASPSGSDSSPDLESSSVLASDLKDLTGSARVKRKPRKVNLETPFPEDFSVTETELELASNLGLREPSERAHFRDKALAHGWTAKDWRARYRTWLRKAAEFAQQRGRPPGAVEHAERQPLPPAREFFKDEPEVLANERVPYSELRVLLSGDGRRL